MSEPTIRNRDDGTLDEVIVENPVCVHLEQMDDDSWWLGIDLADGRQIHVNLVTRGRKRREGRPAQKPQRIYGTAEVERRGMRLWLVRTFVRLGLQCPHVLGRREWRPARLDGKPARHCGLCETTERLTQAEFYAQFGRICPPESK